MTLKTEIEWAELHAPLFLAGTNLGQKLDPKKRTGLKMIYDEDKRHLYVIYNAQMARVPETSVLSMVERSNGKVAQLVEREPEELRVPGSSPGFATTPADVHAGLARRNEAGASSMPQINRTVVEHAQVSTPVSHVFAGPGGGQTGQEPPKRGPGRPPGPKGAA